MKKIGLSDDSLIGAIDEMLNGLIDADLGGWLLKKRIALPGRGKSGGTRTIIATKREDKWFYIYGFEKSEIDNIGSKELQALQKLAKDLLSYNEKQIREGILLKEMEEITYGDEI